MGPIQRIRVSGIKDFAFVTYKDDANAQFAKKVMAHQRLDHEEVLHC
jgi:hypothetical protein